MMTGADILSHATLAGLVLLALALLMTLYRIVRGPSTADRVMALDLLTLVALGFVGVLAVRTGLTLYLDIAIALALVGFLATVALARYMLMRAEARRPPESEPKGRDHP